MFKGMLVDDTIDFAISAYSVRKSRSKAADYLITSHSVGEGRFYIKNPSDTYDWTVFFQPLYREAWIGLIVFSFVIPFLIAMLAYFRKYP